MDQVLKPFIAAFSKSQDVFDTADTYLVMLTNLERMYYRAATFSLTKNS